MNVIQFMVLLLYILPTGNNICVAASTPPPIRDTSLCPSHPGTCLNGITNNIRAVKVEGFQGIDGKANVSCLQECLKYENATGCQLTWEALDDSAQERGWAQERGCYVMTDEVTSTKEAKNSLCWAFSQCAGSFYLSMSKFQR